MVRNSFAGVMRCLQRPTDRKAIFTRRFHLERLEERVVFDTYLVSNLSNSGAGSLRAAVVAANAHTGEDSIQFKSNLNGVIVLQSELSVTGETHILGNSNRRVTVSGNDTTRVLKIAAGADVELKNLIITKGKATDADGGGGILNFGNLEIERSIITGNRADRPNSTATFGGRGGGIHSLGNLEIDDSEITNNFAGVIGGGVFNEGKAIIEDSHIDKNEAGESRTGVGTIRGEGGGISNGISKGTPSAATLKIDHSTVDQNTAGGDAAGIFSGQGTNLVLNRSTVSGNVATRFGTGGIAIAGNATLLDSQVTKNTGAASGIYLFDDFTNAVETVRIARTEIAENTGNEFDKSFVGGLWNRSHAAIQIEDSLIRDNTATFLVGGIEVGFAGEMKILRSTISGNQGGLTGGIDGGSSVTVDSSTINNNTGITAGGISTGFNGNFKINASTISNNKATPTYFYGAGGILGNAQLVNSTISGNVVDATNVPLNAPYVFLTPHVAGGWAASPSYLPENTSTVENSTIAFNSAINVDPKVQSAGGVIGFSYLDPPFVGNANVQTRNTIIARNQVNGQQNDAFGTFDSKGTNLIGVLTNGATGFVPSDLRGSTASPLDPRLGALAWNGGSTMTHRLHPLSPAINAGNNTGVPATDQRGYKRIALGRVDIGSYEYLSFPMYCDSEFSRVGDDSEPISRDNSKPIERIVSDDGLVKVGFATIRATGNWNVSSTKSAVVSQEFPKLKIGISGELNSRLADHLFKGDVSNLFE